VGIFSNRRPFNLSDVDITLDEEDTICLISTYDRLQSFLSPDPIEQLIQLKIYHQEASQLLLFLLDKLTDQGVDLDEIRAYLESERQRDDMRDHIRKERSLNSA
jgi:DNA-binding transcriptional MerR regulator